MDYFIFYMMVVTWGGKGLEYISLQFKNLETLNTTDYPMYSLKGSHNWFLLFDIDSDNKTRILNNVWGMLKKEMERQ